MSNSESEPRERSSLSEKIDAPKNNGVIDLAQAPVGDLLVIVGRQPAKYWLWAGGIAITALSLAGKFGYQQGVSEGVLQVKTEMDTHNSDLKQQVTKLQNRVANLEKDLGASNNVLAKSNADHADLNRRYQDAQSEIQRLSNQVSDRNRKIEAARGCEKIRADVKDYWSQLDKLRKQADSERSSGKGEKLQGMQVEADLLSAKIRSMKEQLDNCAK